MRSSIIMCSSSCALHLVLFTLCSSSCALFTRYFSYPPLCVLIFICLSACALLCVLICMCSFFVLFFLCSSLCTHMHVLLCVCSLKVYSGIISLLWYFTQTESLKCNFLRPLREDFSKSIIHLNDWSIWFHSISFQTIYKVDFAQKPPQPLQRFDISAGLALQN